MTGSDAPTPSVPEAARAGASDCFTVRKRWCWPVMGILSLLCVPEPGLTASGMLDFLEVDTSRREPEIHIHFTQPVIYLSHTPGNVAGEFQVQLRTAGPANPEAYLLGHGRLDWNPTAELPLRGVVVVTDSSVGVQVNLSFQQPVSVRIRPTTSRTVLTIAVDALSLPTSLPDPVSRSITPPRGAPVDEASARLLIRPILRGGERTDEYRAYTTVIELKSSPQSMSRDKLTGRPEFEGRILYEVRPADRVPSKFYLRVGFFADDKTAAGMAESLRDEFPQVRTLTVAAAERDRVLARIKPALSDADLALNEMSIVPEEFRMQPQQSYPIPELEPPQLDEEQLQALMELARKSMVAEDYASAISVYTKVFQYGFDPYRQEALEYIGLAREKNGQIAHAKAEYDRYLEMYPDGDGATRVDQRLQGLITAVSKPQEKLREAKPDDNAGWDVFGSYSQYYRRNQITFDDGRDDVVNLSGLFNDVDVNLRRRSTQYDVRMRLTGDFLYNFETQDAGSDGAITSAFVDINALEHNWSMRLGRQSRSTGGVLGRFDGLLAAYAVTDRIRVNGLVGYPVLSSRDGVNQDRTVRGLGLELGTYGDAWDFFPYYVEQNINGLSDRQAVGLETHYFRPNLTILTLIDYDISYNELNNFYFFGSWTLPNRLSLNATADYRKSPILTTYNALIGQPFFSFEELATVFLEDELRQLAVDRTAESHMVSLGLVYPIGQFLQVYADVTATELTDTIGSGGVAPTPGTDMEIYYSTQFVASNIIGSGSSLILALRQADGTTTDTTSISLNGRFPAFNSWRINPRFRADRRTNSMNELEQWIYLPSIRVDYRPGRTWTMEVEAGYEINDLQTMIGDNDSSSYYFSLGYRAIF